MKNIPIYVTRERHDGMRGYLSLNPWLAVTVLTLAAFNALLWGIYGIIQAVGCLI